MALPSRPASLLAQVRLQRRLVPGQRRREPLPCRVRQRPRRIARSAPTGLPSFQWPGLPIVRQSDNQFASLLFETTSSDQKSHFHGANGRQAYDNLSFPGLKCREAQIWASPQLGRGPAAVRFAPPVRYSRTSRRRSTSAQQRMGLRSRVAVRQGRLTAKRSTEVTSSHDWGFSFSGWFLRVPSKQHRQ